MNKITEPGSTKSAVAEVYGRWLDAVARHDLDAIISFYADDVIAFDAILALQFRGREAYRNHWKACLEMCPMEGKEPVFEMRDLDVKGEGDVAFAHALMRCGYWEGERVEASWMRMTSGLRRIDGEWKIVHEHFSAPFEMPSGKAMFHLSPDAPADALRPVPPGMNTVTPHIVCPDAPAAMAFYKKAFGAMETAHGRLEVDGEFLHGQLIIGDSTLMIAQEDPRCGMASPQTLKGTPVQLHLYVPDVDQAFRRAVEAGAKEIMPVTDMFWGDRYGVLEDPYGHRWSLATHVRDLSPDEIRNAAQAFRTQTEASTK